MPRLIDLTSERALRVERDGELLRADILEKCAAAIETIGDEPAGFALVVWNKEGEMRTTYDASRGPIGPALLPTLASDALNRHVAVMLARDSEVDDSAGS